MKTTVLMKYVKLGWRMRGEANERNRTKSIGLLFDWFGNRT